MRMSREAEEAMRRHIAEIDREVHDLSSIRSSTLQEAAAG